MLKFSMHIKYPTGAIMSYLQKNLAFLSHISRNIAMKLNRKTAVDVHIISYVCVGQLIKGRPL